MPAAPLKLVTCSPRLPGQLTWPAWQTLQSGLVRTDAQDSPHLPHLRTAGVDLLVVDPQPLDDRMRELLSSSRFEPLVWFSPDVELLSALGDRAGVEVIAGSIEPSGSVLLDVVAVMDRLRSPGGCPWDAEQTHGSLMPYLLEETYEAYAALEDGNLEDLREELGDVLLQVVFHSRLAQEADAPWSIDDVATGLVDKLVRRHPHVFADAEVNDLEQTWNQIKATEKGRTSVTDGVPLGQPALMLAAKLHKRALRAGLPTAAPPGASELGGELWDLVARAAVAGVDPEGALRATARAFRDQLVAAETGQVRTPNS